MSFLEATKKPAFYQGTLPAKPLRLGSHRLHVLGTLGGGQETKSDGFPEE